jgi:hypothetical protein
MNLRRPYTFALIAAAAVVAACAGDGMRSPTDPSAAATSQQLSAPMDSLTRLATVRPHGLLGDLLGLSKPLPLFVCKNNGGPYTDSAVVGLFGGTLHFGPHSLFVPPAAVFVPTKIKATTYAGDTLAVTFYPQGLHFLLPATLSLDYKHCASQPTSPLQIDYLNDLLTEILSIIPSLDQGTGKVTGTIWHFSVYAGSETRR